MNKLGTMAFCDCLPAFPSFTGLVFAQNFQIFYHVKLTPLIMDRKYSLVKY